MTVLLARAKLAAKWIAALALLVGVVLVALFRKRGPGRLADPIDLALQRYDRATERASARATVEIAVSRAKAEGERDQLLAALADPDEDSRNERLIELAKRLKVDP